MLRDTTSPLPSHFSTATIPASPPPSPLPTNHLSDIYDSAPPSPTLDPANPPRTHEALTDLPALRRTYTTAGYRDGIAASKAEFVQAGFDEGFSLGAVLGLRVGYILGVLEGLVRAVQQVQKKGAGEEGGRQGWVEEVRELRGEAGRELGMQRVMGEEFFDGGGVWRWDVPRAEGKEDVTFREVAEAHPLVAKWMGVVREVAERRGVNLEVLEREEISEESGLSRE